MDKRVHFQIQMYNLRIGLAILDWNENVDRPASSVKNVVCARNPRRRSAVRVLKPKTFDFVDVLWAKFSRYAEHHCPQNLQDIEDVEYSSDSDSESDDDD